VERVNHNVKLLRFSTQSDNQDGLPVASCILFRYIIADKDNKQQEVIRPYTPIAMNEVNA
jgi:hypothetical protein